MDIKCFVLRSLNNDTMYQFLKELQPVEKNNRYKFRPSFTKNFYQSAKFYIKEDAIKTINMLEPYYKRMCEWCAYEIVEVLTTVDAKYANFVVYLPEQAKPQEMNF